MPTPIKLSIQLSESLPRPLLRLFQRGVELEVELGCDLLTLLTEDLCLSDSGIAKIQTIFWQGHPVDELSGCIIEEDGVLALSAALPGLVGACLRRGGTWSALRDSISYRSEFEQQSRKRGVITLKLFNFMLEEVGPLLLERGIMTSAVRGAGAIRESGIHPDRVIGSIDGELVSDLQELLEQPRHDQRLLLQIHRSDPVE